VVGACAGVFRDYVTARTHAKAFAVNPDGHCGFNIAARTLDEAKDEALKLCSGHWPDCKLCAAGQEV
jgi:hypothetical protein